MIRLLISLVTVGAVISCSMEDTETSGALTVDPNSANEIPDWLSIADVDHNRDGTIDIYDLVLVAHYFGQDVPEDEVRSVEQDLPDQTADESDPCRDIRKGVRFPNVEPVIDNTEFKERFDAPSGGTYVYMLLGMQNSLSSSLPEYELDPVYRYPSCVAIRIHFDGNLEPKESKTKLVAGYGKTLSNYSIPSFQLQREIHCNSDNKSACKSIGHADNEKAFLTIRFMNYSSGSPLAKTYPVSKRLLKLGVPFGNDRVIRTIVITTNGLRYVWHIERIPNRYPLEHVILSPASRHGKDAGVYIKMLPSEVRRRYFPEDIE